MKGGGFIYAVALGSMLGAACGLPFHFSIYLIAAILLAAFFIFLLRPRALPFVVTGVFLASLALGAVRADVFLQNESRNTLERFIGSTHVVSGTIADDPVRTDTALHAPVDVQSVDGVDAHGTLLAEMPRDAQVRFNDAVELRGAVSEPQPFAASGGREFDYPNYLRVHGISALMQRAQLRDAQPGAFSVSGALFSIKRAFESSVERVFPEPQSSLLEGILLGEKKACRKS